MSSVLGWINSNSMVLVRPSDNVYGGTKPVLWAFVESYWVVEQYFLIRTELMVGLILKMNAMASKKYPPAIPIQ